MNKILATIWLFAAAMCFTACESEDPLQPSNADTNPFITDDNADDEESLLRKEFYSKNSCYLLFNDTLNTGELLDLGYMMTASQNNNAYTYDYLATIEEKHLATQFVEQYLLPHLGKKLRPFSFLLVNNINHFKYEDGQLWEPDDGITNPSFVVGVRATAIAMSAITEMSESEKNDYSKELIIEILANIISHQTIETFNAFTSYGKKYYGVWMEGWVEGEEDGMPLQNAKSFIAPHQDIWGVWWTAYPTLDEDVKAYINLAMNTTLEEVEEKYTEYPDIISKYKLMKQIITELGYIK